MLGPCTYNSKGPRRRVGWEGQNGGQKRGNHPSYLEGLEVKPKEQEELLEPCWGAPSGRTAVT